ncbi:hypothetical protein ACP275_08G120100 [Erythranthe tilingii]
MSSWFFYCLLPFFLLPFFWLCITADGGRAQWQTLDGNAPLVIARGGFSGIFPDSSSYAYEFAVDTRSPDLQVWCDIHLTKDSVGICFPNLRLELASAVDHVYKNNSNIYYVNGVKTEGWFALDFTRGQLAAVNLRRQTLSRPERFDHSKLPIQTIDDVVGKTKNVGLWLNVPYDAFYSQHNMSMMEFVISVASRMNVSYISSPEVGFLRSIESKFRTGTTKLIFQLLQPSYFEPSTNQTYSSFLNNLTFIKGFAEGIVIPKYYIWEVDNGLYLQNYTSLVMDAHKAGLQVFASGFANDDVTLAYNYSYDPLAEYLSFVDNGQFSVDGVLSDFPSSASAAIDCFSHMGKNKILQEELLIISAEGASGDYPGCTDRAYSKAVADGVDVLDCPVQITSDGIPFCLGSINLVDRTTAAKSNFKNLATTNPDLNITDGVFAYNLTWNQIQTLLPEIFDPFLKYILLRNPRATNVGNFMQLSDFLAFANNASSVSGVLISIENAAYLAKQQGLGVTEASSSRNYELVYLINKDISDILNSTILEIKQFANAVVITKRSVFPTNQAYIFVSQPWDFLSNPYLEIYSYVVAMGIDGVVTPYPATAAKFTRNRCLGYKDAPLYMRPPQPGGLIKYMAAQDLPPAKAPNPILTDKDVLEPPLPSVNGSMKLIPMILVFQLIFMFF